MHIWHHSKKLLERFGVNFGLTLNIWSYLFKTNHILDNGRHIELGFEGDEEFPDDFINQELYSIKSKK